MVIEMLPSPLKLSYADMKTGRAATLPGCHRAAMHEFAVRGSSLYPFQIHLQYSLTLRRGSFFPTDGSLVAATKVNDAVMPPSRLNHTPW
jgi:hypothetical protein